MQLKELNKIKYRFVQTILYHCIILSPNSKCHHFTKGFNILTYIFI